MLGNALTKIKYYIDNHKCPVCMKKATIYEVMGEGYYVECSTCTPFHFPKNFMLGFLTNGLDDHKKYEVTKRIQNHNRFINVGKIKRSPDPASRLKAAKYKNLHYPIYKEFLDQDAAKYFAIWRSSIKK